MLLKLSRCVRYVRYCLGMLLSFASLNVVLSLSNTTEIRFVNNDAPFTFCKKLLQFGSFPIFLLHKQSSYTTCIELHTTQRAGKRYGIRRSGNSVRVDERN